MEMIPMKPERKAQLEEYAQRHGQDATAALDDMLAGGLGMNALLVRALEARFKRVFVQPVDGIQRGYEDVKAGRTRPASEFLEELRAKHGFPR